MGNYSNGSVILLDYVGLRFHKNFNVRRMTLFISIVKSVNFTFFFLFDRTNCHFLLLCVKNLDCCIYKELKTIEKIHFQVFNKHLVSQAATQYEIIS